MEIDDYLRKARDGEPFSKLELAVMLAYHVESTENIRILLEANSLSKELSQNQAEIHAQLALNLAPCPGNCGFCSFARENGVFQEEIRITPEQAICYAQQFEADGANAVFVMTTATYPFELSSRFPRKFGGSSRRTPSWSPTWGISPWPTPD